MDSSKLKRVGLLGGTFNPPHQGHLRLARWLIENGVVDEVRLVVSKIPPHKERAALVSFDDRLRMTRLAAGESSGIVVSDVESKREGPSYTIDTIELLRAAEPECRFFWIIGEDNISELITWHRASELLDTADFIVVRRKCAGDEGYSKLSTITSEQSIQKLRQSVVESPLFDQSSTEIRRLFESGASPASNVLSPAVVEYINKNRLYWNPSVRLESANKSFDINSFGLIGLLVMVLLLQTVGIFNHALWTPDEPRVAEIGREMWASGDYIVPVLGSEPFLEKPPLYWWLVSASYQIFGVSDHTARFPSLFAAIVTAILTFFVARRLGGNRLAFFSVAALVTMGGFHQYTHKCMVDSLLMMFVTLGYFSFYKLALDRPDSGKRIAPGYTVLLWTSGGLAFLAKGPIGIVLIFGPIVIFCLYYRMFYLLKTFEHIFGAILMIGISSIWPLMLYSRGGWDLLDGFVVDNILGRVVTTIGDDPGKGGHKHPFYYYITQSLPMIIPWAIVLPAAYVKLAKHADSFRISKQTIVFFSMVFPVGVVLLSIPSTKRGVYLLPLVPSLAVFIGMWLGSIATSTIRPLDVTFSRIANLLLALIAACLPLGLLVFMIWPEVIEGKFELEHFGDSLRQQAFFTALIVAAIALPLCFRLHKSIRLSSPDIAKNIVLTVFVLFVGHDLIVYPLLDVMKDLHRLGDELAKFDIQESGLVGYDLDETTRAIIPFDLGFNPINIEKKEDVMAFISENDHLPLLFTESRLDEFPEEFRLKLSLIGSWDFGGRRVYQLYKFVGNVKQRP
ncbi:MAG: nicotinate (nicotinamide) nucleotide adenylyltransferase [Planctomycetes bacterium]|nr:nicotinate (nicotinamide) nucleotide adenylyltransferase [Planctomycetota bacterium]